MHRRANEPHSGRARSRLATAVGHQREIVPEPADRTPLYALAGTATIQGSRRRGGIPWCRNSHSVTRLNRLRGDDASSVRPASGRSDRSNRHRNGKEPGHDRLRSACPLQSVRPPDWPVFPACPSVQHGRPRESSRYPRCRGRREAGRRRLVPDVPLPAGCRDTRGKPELHRDVGGYVKGDRSLAPSQWTGPGVALPPAGSTVQLRACPARHGG